MSVKVLTTISLTVFAFGFSSMSFAQTPQERAAKIKEWRSNCGDPDPDLRLAYIEAAIESADQTVIRTCLQQTLKNDNPDTRNMALRAAIASSERLTLIFDMPAAYYEAIEKSNGDSEKIEKIDRDYRYFRNVVEVTDGQLGLLPKDVNFGAQASNWQTLWKNTKPEDNITAEFTIVGDRLSGSGRAYIHNSAYSEFTVGLSLTSDGQLVGTGQFGKYSDFQVSIKLF